MNENITNRVLIAYSSNFKQNLVFKNKVEKITTNLDKFQIISVDDNNKFIENFYKNHTIEKIKYENLGKGALRKILETISHAIIFWDGTDLIDLVYLSFLLRINTRLIPVVTTRVVNKDKGQKYDVYIGRGTPWGNPYAIGENGQTRDEVINKFKKYFISEIISNDEKRKDLLSLRGSTLGCHCKPLACHGDVIADYLNTLDEEPLF